MQKKRVVITGGAGFIGSNLAEKIIQDNDVTIIDDFSTGKWENIAGIIHKKNLNVINGNILDRDLLGKNFQGVDYVFHEAAMVSVVRSIDDPMLTNEVNIKGTLNVLLAARNNRVKKVVFASSAAIFGDSTQLPNKENERPNAQSPYALTKIAGEYYCQILKKIYGLPTICLRYFNVYGPRQSPSSDYAAVIPSFISSVLKNEPPVIYGDGKQTRDFVYIEDIVQANLLAAESNAFGVFNVGGGRNISINDLALTIIKISGRNLQPTYKESRPGDIRDSLADISLARSMGYNPRYTLENGLRETIEKFPSVSLAKKLINESTINNPIF